jgi:hypothetical protein
MVLSNSSRSHLIPTPYSARCGVLRSRQGTTSQVEKFGRAECRRDLRALCDRESRVFDMIVLGQSLRA